MLKKEKQLPKVVEIALNNTLPTYFVSKDVYKRQNHPNDLKWTYLLVK